MEIEVLGPFRMFVGRASIVPSAAKPRTLLALLALFSGRLLPVSALLEEVWGTDRPRSAVTTLQSYVSQLRKVIGRVLPDRDPKLVLRTERGGYLLDWSAGWLDAAEFECLAASGLQSFAEHDYQTADLRFRDALVLWRGPMLENVPVGPLLSAEIARLQRSRLTVLHHRVECDLRRGRYQQAADELTDLIGRYPGYETFQRQFEVAVADRSGVVGQEPRWLYRIA